LRKIIGLDPPDVGSFQEALSLEPDEWRHGLAVMETVFLNQFDRLVVAAYYLAHLNDPDWRAKRAHHGSEPVFPPNVLQDMARRVQKSKAVHDRDDFGILDVTDDYAASESNKAWRAYEEEAPGLAETVRLLEQDLVQPSNVRTRTHARQVGQAAFFDEALAMIVDDLKLRCIQRNRTTKLKPVSEGRDLHQVEPGLFTKLQQTVDGLAVLYLPPGWYPASAKQPQLSGSASRLRDRFKPEKLARRGHPAAWIASLVKQASKYTAHATA